MSNKPIPLRLNLGKAFDPSEWQYQDESGQVHQIVNLTREDLMQVVCRCMAALEAAEAACMNQQAVFSAWRTGREVEGA